MRWIESIKNRVQERRVNKLEKDLTALRSKMKFDPRLLSKDFDVETVDTFTRRVYEYKLWSMGNAGALCWFYRTGNAHVGKYEYNKHNYFWAKCPPTRRMVHCGIPGLISTRMADILFKNGVKVNSIVYKDTEGESLKEDKDAEKKADEFISATLLPALKLQDNLQQAAVVESWGGHCFMRLSHDVSTSAYPILETFDVTKGEVIKTRGITKAIVFKTWYEHNGKSYRLDEIYSTTDDGDACITYRLFTFDGNKEKECGLLAIPQTRETFFFKGQGNENGIRLDDEQRFVYKGLKGMLAFEKPNKTPSQEFPTSCYGASDYEGSVDYFDSLDEITSGNVREIRTNETKRYAPDSLLDIDPETGVPIGIDEFCDSYVVVKGDTDQDATNKIEVVQVADKTESFLSKWKTVLSMICNKAKISPYSLGITWLEAVGPAADSLQERNKVTLDMRTGKLALWEPVLKELLLRALQLCTWMQGNADGVLEQHKADGVPELDFTNGNATLQLDFGEYIQEGVTQRINTWSSAKSSRVASTNECVRQIHPDWTDKQVDDEVNLIRFEDGMSLDNPANLPELTGKDDEV